jgi:hypothetical protein
MFKGFALWQLLAQDPRVAENAREKATRAPFAFLLVFLQGAL